MAEILPGADRHHSAGNDQKFQIVSAKQTENVFTLLTLGIIAEAAIFQVTSYLPVDNNIFYHSFAIVYILTIALRLPTGKSEYLENNHCVRCLRLVWWSQSYWKYISKICFTCQRKGLSLRIPMRVIPMQMW